MREIEKKKVEALNQILTFQIKRVGFRFRPNNKTKIFKLILSEPNESIHFFFANTYLKMNPRHPRKKMRKNQRRRRKK